MSRVVGVAAITASIPLPAADVGFHMMKGTRSQSSGPPILLVGLGNPAQPSTGILEYSLNGRLIRHLTSNSEDSQPQIVEGRQVDYAREVSAPCRFDIESMSLSSMRSTALRTGIAGLVSFGASPDGRALAYEASSGKSCTQSGENLVIINLRSGTQHTIRDVPRMTTLSWSPNDDSLLAEGPPTLYASSDVLELHDPLVTSAEPTVVHLPCPQGRQHCTQRTPQYDTLGDIVYVAVLDPIANRPCSIYACTRQRYTVTQVEGERVIALFTSVSTAGAPAWTTVDSTGQEVVATVPSSSGHWISWVIVRHHVIHADAPIGEPALQ